MSDRKDSQEPSMEEILTSIRRIIADEDRETPDPKGGGQSNANGDGARASKAEEEDVLELTEVVADEARDRPASAAGAASERQGATAPVAADAASAEELELAPTGASAAPQPAAKQESAIVSSRETKSDSLVSDDAAGATSGAFSKLSEAVRPKDEPSPASSLTVEQLLTEMLRPMLKEWLDENLPKIVERLVQQELSKLARRAELM